MTEPNHRTEELASRLRRLLGPTEVGPQTGAAAHWDTMPRWNEPDREFTRADEPTSAEKIRAMSREPAVQLNMNVGSRAATKSPIDADRRPTEEKNKPLQLMVPPDVFEAFSARALARPQDVPRRRRGEAAAAVSARSGPRWPLRRVAVGRQGA